jgi:rare lipoprotein A
MPSRARRAAGLALLCLTLASCAGSDRPRAGGSGGYKPVSDAPVRIGQPYTVRGVTYYPRDDRRYDETGMASWYGSESGSRTANGEQFRPGGYTAAHKTLPLPTYVEVTALDTGRTILVRINDRGPFATGRIIDLSRGSAEALGILRAGSARVRVRRVEPPERDREALRAGRMAAVRRTGTIPVYRPTTRSSIPPRPIPAPPRPSEPAVVMVPQPTPLPSPVGPVRPRLQLDLPPPEPDTPLLSPSRGLPDSPDPISPGSIVDPRATLAQVQVRGYQKTMSIGAIRRSSGPESESIR